MIAVKVKYFAEIKDITQKKEDLLSMKPGSTIKDIVARLSEAYGENFRTRILPDDMRLKDDYTILLNGESVDFPDSGKLLEDGDEVVILPPIAGGSHTYAEIFMGASKIYVGRYGYSK